MVEKGPKPPEFRPDVENLDLPAEARWGGRFMNAVKNTFHGVTTRRALSREGKQLASTANEAWDLQAEAKIAGERADREVIAGQSAELELDELQRAAERGKAHWWSRDPVKKYDKAKVRHEKDDVKRGKRIREFETAKTDKELAHADAFNEKVSLEKSITGRTTDYLDRLAKQSRPLDEHWNLLEKRKGDLDGRLEQCKKALDEQRGNIAKVETLFRTKRLDPEDKARLTVERDRAIKLTERMEAQIKNTREGLATLDKKQRRLIKPRQNLHRLTEGMKQVQLQVMRLGEAPEPDPLSSATLAPPGTTYAYPGGGAPGTPGSGGHGGTGPAGVYARSARFRGSPDRERIAFSPDAAVLKEMLESVGEKPVRLGDYIKIWNDLYRKSPIKDVPPAEAEKVLKVKDIETLLTKWTEAGPEKNQEFIDSIAADTGPRKANLEERLQDMRVELYFYD